MLLSLSLVLHYRCNRRNIIAPMCILIMMFKIYVSISLLSQYIALNTTSASQNRDCGFNFVCERGFCHPTIPFLCQCEPNWIGVLCDTFLCPPGYECRTSTGVLNCFTQPSDATNTSVQTSTENRAIMTFTTDQPEVHKPNACKADYELRPVSQRQCIPGFMCQYGVCKLDTSSESQLAMACHCDDGAIGTYCDFKCCRDCGQFGKCVNIATGFNRSEQFCACHQNYTGNFCGERRKNSDTGKHNRWRTFSIGCSILIKKYSFQRMYNGFTEIYSQLIAV